MQSTVRLNSEVKTLLDSYKISNSESYEEVILRFLEYFAEDQLELSEELKTTIKYRLKNLEKGKILSATELIEKMNNKRKRMHV